MKTTHLAEIKHTIQIAIDTITNITKPHPQLMALKGSYETMLDFIRKIEGNKAMWILDVMFEKNRYYDTQTASIDPLKLLQNFYENIYQSSEKTNQYLEKFHQKNKEHTKITWNECMRAIGFACFALGVWTALLLVPMGIYIDQLILANYLGPIGLLAAGGGLVAYSYRTNEIRNNFGIAGFYHSLSINQSGTAILSAIVFIVMSLRLGYGVPGISSPLGFAAISITLTLLTAVAVIFHSKYTFKRAQSFDTEIKSIGKKNSRLLHPSGSRMNFFENQKDWLIHFKDCFNENWLAGSYTHQALSSLKEPDYSSAEDVKRYLDVRRHLITTFQILEKNLPASALGNLNIEQVHAIEMINPSHFPGLSTAAANTLCALHHANPKLNVSFLLSTVNELATRNRPWESLAAFSRIAKSCPNQITERSLNQLKSMDSNSLEIRSHDIEKEAKQGLNYLSRRSGVSSLFTKINFEESVDATTNNCVL